MVYVKQDGTHGFNWKLQYEFLLKEHPEYLEGIVDSRLAMLGQEQPAKFTYYEALRNRLRQKIDSEASRDESFGYLQSDIVTKNFVKNNNLTSLFSEVPQLCTKNNR